MRKTKKTVRAGLIGSGFAASLHIEAAARVYGTNVEIVGVYSPTKANARHFAGVHGLDVLASAEAVRWLSRRWLRANMSSWRSR